MKRNITLLLLSIIAVISISFSCSSIASTKAAGTFSYRTLSHHVAYNIEGTNGAFYIVFERREASKNNRATGELGRLEYFINDVEYEKNDDLSVNFVGIEKSMIGTGLSFNSYSHLDESEARHFLLTEKCLNTMLIVKDSANSNSRILVRDGVTNYSQKSLIAISGDTKDYVYGIYVTGFTGRFTFEPIYSFDQNIYIAYDEGISISNDDYIDFTVEYENCNQGETTIHYEEKKYRHMQMVMSGVISNNPNQASMFKELYVNDQTVDYILRGDDGKNIYYLDLKDGDNVKIQYEIVDIEVEEAKVYNFYDVTGVKSITFEEESVNYPIGSINASVNTALRLRYTAPNTQFVRTYGWGVGQINKISIFAENYFWSLSGYIISFYGNTSQKIRILSGQEEPLSYASCSDIDIGTTNEIEIGVVKGYVLKDGGKSWAFNRVYVNVNGRLACFYNDFNKRNLGNSLYGPYLEPNVGRYGTCTFFDARDLCHVEEEDDLDSNVTLSYSKYIEKGTDLKIVVNEIGGHIIKDFYVNGEDVTDKITIDGVKKYINIEKVSDDLVLSYSTSSGIYLKTNILSNGNNKVFVYNEDSIPYGQTVSLKMHVERGYVISSLIINGVEMKDSIVAYEDYIICPLSSVKEDLNINIQVQEQVFTLRGEIDHGYVRILTPLIQAGTSASFMVTVDEGYKVTSVLVNDEIVDCVNDVFIINNVTEDLYAVIKTEVVKEEIFANTDSGEEEDKGGCKSSIPLGVMASMFGLIVLLKKRAR